MKTKYVVYFPSLDEYYHTDNGNLYSSEWRAHADLAAFCQWEFHPDARVVAITDPEEMAAIEGLQNQNRDT